MGNLVSTPKKATNLTLSADVLAEAKSLGINVSQVCDQFLRDLVRRERERCWKEAHADFIAAYNNIVGQEDLPLDQWRTF